MRTLDDVERELAALGRPRFNPYLLIQAGGKRPELEAWRAANPGGEEAYAALFAEREALEAIAAKRHEFDAGVLALGAGLRIQKALGALTDTPAAVAAREWWAARAKTWLVILGHTGVGKSVAAAAVARGVKGATWLPATKLMTAVGFEAEGEALARTPLLVLDDYGTEHVSAFARSCWHQVLAARHEDERPTILTANLTRPQLREALGSRLADRIASDCTMLEFLGPSLRRDR